MTQINDINYDSWIENVINEHKNRNYYTNI